MNIHGCLHLYIVQRIGWMLQMPALHITDRTHVPFPSIEYVTQCFYDRHKNLCDWTSSQRTASPAGTDDDVYLTAAEHLI